jgi:hypothetical protein
MADLGSNELGSVRDESLAPHTGRRDAALERNGFKGRPRTAGFLGARPAPVINGRMFRLPALTSVRISQSFKRGLRVP